MRSFKQKLISIKMHVFLVCILAFGCAVAASANREKRQVLPTCQEPDVDNVCTLTGGRIYFAHPTDSTKFLQCADGGRMFIIKCPKGEVYNRDKTMCAPAQVTNPVTSSNNPCTAQNMAIGNIFFAYPSDKTKFIECNSLGQPTVLSCPTRLVYDAGRQSCVLQQGSIVNGGSTGGTVNTGPTNNGTVTSGGNPCTAEAIQSNNLFFPHPDPTKFIQCDLVGNAYVMQCPANLVWSQTTSNCQSRYTSNVLSGTVLTGK